MGRGVGQQLCQHSWVLGLPILRSLGTVHDLCLGSTWKGPVISADISHPLATQPPQDTVFLWLCSQGNSQQDVVFEVAL